jgi:hypothetical protein
MLEAMVLASFLLGQEKCRSTFPDQFFGERKLVLHRRLNDRGRLARLAEPSVSRLTKVSGYES